MKTLTDHLTMYAEYHRDKRNIATHFVGIPLIVLSITTLLSVPALSFSVGGLPLSAAGLLAFLSCLFYLRLDIAFGLTMTAVMTGMVLGGQAIVQARPEQAVMIGIALFVVGWIFSSWDITGKSANRLLWMTWSACWSARCSWWRKLPSPSAWPARRRMKSCAAPAPP